MNSLQKKLNRLRLKQCLKQNSHRERIYALNLKHDKQMLKLFEQERALIDQMNKEDK